MTQSVYSTGDTGNAAWPGRSAVGTRLMVTMLLVMGVVVMTPAIAHAAFQVKPLATNQIAFDSNRTSNWELFIEATDGSNQRQLTKDSRYDSWWPKLSPDRKSLVFYRTPAGVHDTDYSQTSLWRINVDGTGLRRLLATGAYGWYWQGHAEWSPDGTRLVMFGGAKENPQIFITAADGTSPRLVTQNRPGTNIDPSWTPDGRILFIGCPIAACPDTSYEVYRVNADGTGETRLTSDFTVDHDPYSSPDGKSIAWLRQTASYGIYAMNADGSNQHAVIDDGAVSSKPNWSPDSQTIYFHRLPLTQTAFDLFKINPDGTGLAQLVPRPPGPAPYANEFPVNSSY